MDRASAPLQTIEQTLALAGRAHSWLITALAINQPRDATMDEAEEGIVKVNPRDYFQYTTSVHMVVLALDHVDRCLGFITPKWPEAFPRAEAERFRAAWAPLRDLRDVLEHEEDYIAGIGRKPHLQGDRSGWTRGRGGVQVRHFGSGHNLDREGRPVGVVALGKSYDLAPALHEARSLVAPLLRYLWPPDEQKSRPGQKLAGWGYIYNETDSALTLPNGDEVQAGALYSEGTIIADPLPQGMALLERAERWNPLREGWDAASRSFVPISDGCTTSRSDPDGPRPDA